MSIYTLEDLRNAVPEELKNASDHELVLDYSNRLGRDPFDVAEYFGLSTGRGKGDFSAGVSAGVDQLQGLAISAGAGLADIVGAEDTAGYLRDKAEAQSYQSYFAGKPELDRVEDIDSIGGAIDWAQYQFGKQVPIMLGITAAQFAPGLGQAATATGLARLGALAPRAMGGGALKRSVLSRVGPKTLAETASVKQGAALAKSAMVSSGLGFGSLYQASGADGDPDPWKALALSPLYGLAEAAVPAALTGAARMKGGFTGNIASRVGKATATSSVTEAATEAFQTELELGLDTSMTPEERASQRINAALAGAVVGGGFGSAGGVIQRRVENNSLGETDLAGNTDPESAPQFTGAEEYINDSYMPRNAVEFEGRVAELARGREEQANSQAENMEFAYGDGPAGTFANNLRTEIYESDSISLGSRIAMERASVDVNNELAGIDEQIAELSNSKLFALLSNKNKKFSTEQEVKLEALLERRERIRADADAVAGRLAKADFSSIANNKLSALRSATNKMNTAEDGSMLLSEPLDEFESAILSEADPELFGSLTQEAEATQEEEIDLGKTKPEVVDDLFDGVDATAETTPDQTPEEQALQKEIDETLEDSVIDDAMAKQMNMIYEAKTREGNTLEASESSEQGKATGRVNLPQGVIQGLVRMMRSSDRTPLAIVYKDGTAQPDQAATVENIEFMRDVHSKIMAVVKASSISLNTGKQVIKKLDSGKRSVSDGALRRLESASNLLPISMQALVDKVGGAKNLEAIIASNKVRNEKSRSSLRNTDKYASIGRFLNKKELDNQLDLETTVDVALSSAFAQYKNGTLGQMDVISGRHTRYSKTERASYSSSITPLTVLDPKEGISGLLKRVAGAEGTVSAYGKNLATQIREVLDPKGANSDVKVAFIEDTVGEYSRYEPSNNTIYLHREASQEEILHEAMHAATQFWVYENPTSAEVADLSRSLDELFAFVGDGTTKEFKAINMPEEHKQKALEIVGKLQAVRAKESNKTANLDAVLELMAYGTTLREFRDLLKSIKSEPSPETAVWKTLLTSVWGRVAEVFSKFLGVKGTVANNVLDTSMMVLESARSPASKTSEAPQGNTLYMDTTDAAPVDRDGKPIDTTLFDTASDNKGVFDVISSRFLFNAVGWPKANEKINEKRAEWAEHIRTKMPRLARHTSKIASHFQLPPAVRHWFKLYKEQRNTGYTNLEFLAYFIANEDPVRTKALLEHLDGDSTAINKLENMVHLKDMADSVRSTIDKYVQELPANIQEQFVGKKFSEFLIYVDDESTISSHSMSMGALATQIRKQGVKIDRQMLVDLHPHFFQTDMNGDAILEGRFLEAKVTPHNGDPAYPLMVSEEVFKLKQGQLLSPDGVVTVKRDSNFEVFLYDDKSSSIKFKNKMTYKDSFDAAKARTIANAMRNTMGGIASYYASQNFYQGMAIQGKESGQVFDTIEEINEFFAGANMGDGPGMKRPMTLEEAGTDKLRADLRTRGTFVQYPNTPELYGALAGKIVHGPTHTAMTDMSDRNPIIQSEAYNAALRTFKKAKTIYNPGTGVTNVLSNVSLAIMHQIPLKTVAQATKLLWKFHRNSGDLSPSERAAMRAFMESGALLGNYSNVEIKKTLFESIEKHIVPDGHESVMSRVTTFLNLESDKRSLIGKLVKRGKKFDSVVTQVYAAEDNAFRLAAFLKHVGDAKANSADGVATPQILQEAGRYAREAFLDYDIDSSAVKAARQTAFPFISWTYAIVPVLGRIALTQPWAMANLLASYALIDVAAAALAGDDDEARKKGPERLDERMFGIGPRMHIRIPFIGDEDNPVYYRLGDYVPLASSTKGMATNNGFAGQDWWPQGLQPGSPILSAVLALIGGVDPYTGDPLHEVGDSNMDKALELAKFSYDVFAPPIIRAGNFEKAAAAYSGDVNFAGQKVDVGKLLFAQVLGLKVVGYNIDQEHATRAFLDSQATRDYKAAIAKAKRDETRSGNPNWKKLDEITRDYEDQLIEELNKIYKTGE